MQKIITLGNTTIDALRYVANTPYGVTELNRYEMIILQIMMTQPQRVFTREVLLQKMEHHWVELSNRVVDVRISRLRLKLRRIKSDLQIEARRGVGYFVRF